IKDKGKYYTVRSSGRGFTVTESRFLTRFEREERVWTAPDSSWNSYNHWAPELHSIGGKWYIYYAASLHQGPPFFAQRTGVLEAADPFGPYVDKGMIYTGDDGREVTHNL